MFILTVFTNSACRESNNTRRVLPQTQTEIFAEVRDVFQQSGRTENIPPAVQLVSKTGSVRHVAEQQNIHRLMSQMAKIHACRLFPKESCNMPIQYNMPAT